MKKNDLKQITTDLQSLVKEMNYKISKLEKIWQDEEKAEAALAKEEDESDITNLR